MNTSLAYQQTSAAKPLSQRCIPFKSQGFTLLELLISMALTAMLLGILSAGVYSVVNDWQHETGGLDAELDKTLIVLQVERAMEAAFPHSYIHTQRLSRFVYFVGTEHEVRFVSTVSPQRHRGLTAWDLISDSEQGLQLKLTPAMSDNPDDRFADVEAQTLLADHQASFRYLVQHGDLEKEWLDEWLAEDMQSLPLAIEMTLTALDKNTDEPELLILAPIKANQHETIEATISLF